VAERTDKRTRAATVVVAVLVVCLILGIAIDRMVTSHRTQELVYTGRISAICGSAQRLAAGQQCFALRLDTATPPDDCYPGGGDLSLPGLGPGFWGSHAPFPDDTPPGIGDDVRVTVVSTADVGCTPVDIQVVSRAIA
jgi:hypothetical protein